MYNIEKLFSNLLLLFCRRTDMKNLFTLFVVFVVFAIFLNCATASNSLSTIPGGIVYSDGKDAIFLDFATNQEINLTSYIKGIKIDGAFAVSESGQTLVWVQDSKIWSVDLPRGTPRPMDMEFRRGKTKHSRIIEPVDFYDVIWRKPIANIAISPDESKIMFESVHNGLSWTYQATPLDKVTSNLPFFGYVPRSCMAIFSLSRNYNKRGLTDDPNIPRYGNVVELPMAPKFKFNNGPPKVMGFASMKGELSTSDGRMYDKKGIFKSARFPTFQRLSNWQNQKVLAFIHQLDNGKWGPIQIRVMDSPIFGTEEDRPDVSIGEGTSKVLFQEFNSIYPKLRIENGYGSSGLVFANEHFWRIKALQKPRRWEIQIPQLADCQGLAWRPDGSLTIHSKGSVGIIPAKEIQMTLAGGCVEKIPFGSKEFRLREANNVHRTAPSRIASGISGSNICWITDQKFLFLRSDKSVYCSDGTKVIGPIASHFSYCSKSPLDSPRDKKSGRFEQLYAPGRLTDHGTYLSQPLDRKIASTSLGYINTTFSREDALFLKAIVSRIGSQPPIGFCQTQETDFGEVKKQLSTYQVKFNDRWDVINRKERRDLSEKNGQGVASFSPDKILLLNVDNRTVGVKASFREFDRLKTKHGDYVGWLISGEWQVLQDNNPEMIAMQSPNLEYAKLATQKHQERKIATGDRKLSTQKVKLGTFVSTNNLSFKWSDLQNGMTLLVVKYKYQEEGPTLSFALSQSQIEEIDDWSNCDWKINEENRSKLKKYKGKFAFQSIQVNVGGTVILQYKDTYLALRPMEISKDVVLYKRKIIR